MSLSGNGHISKGDFTISMAPQEAKNAGEKSGVFGHIKFMPLATAPKTNALKLLQIVKVVDNLGADLSWAGSGEARRDSARTTADSAHGVEGGYFVDALHASRTPRTASTDAAVSPYYNEDYKSRADAPGNFQDGWQKGGTDQKEAILRDYPGTTGASNLAFKFETAAKAEDTGVVFGTIKWQFSIVSKKITGDSFSVHEAESATFDAAVDKFNDTYHNPGSPSAPAPPSPAPAPGVTPPSGPPPH